MPLRRKSETADGGMRSVDMATLAARLNFESWRREERPRDPQSSKGGGEEEEVVGMEGRLCSLRGQTSTRKSNR